MKMNKFFLFSVLSLIFIFSCSKSSTSSDPNTGTSLTDAIRAQAVASTASSNTECSTLPTDFYYEIGDKNGALTSGAAGSGGVTASTSMLLASGSKWIFGSYVVQYKNGVALSTPDLQALQMQTGNISFTGCSAGVTVDTCYAAGSNSTTSATAINKFNYGGGHFELWGHNNGLGSDNNAALNTEFKNKLGSDLAVVFLSPNFAGGMYSNSTQYAVFLQKILNQQILISGSLGAHPVCTNNCGYATYAPVPEEWHYSLGHWVEDDPTTGDGAFSSPGLYGFYPWIDSSKTYYGIVARYDTANAGNAVATSSYWRSVLCGRLLRKAWLTGTAQ